MESYPSLSSNYVNRNTADRVLVQDLVKSVATVSEALDILAETLDPPSDQYTATQHLSRIFWQPGERIEDFFFSTKRRAVEANVDMKFVAPLIAAQLPRDVETKIKATIVGIAPELDGPDCRKLLIAIKKELQEKGYSPDCGSRKCEAIEKVAVIEKEHTDSSPNISFEGRSEKFDMESTVYSTNYQPSHKYPQRNRPQRDWDKPQRE